MSNTINTRIKVKRDTTQHWNEAIGFIPLQGEIIVYEDYETKTYLLEQDGQTVTETVNIPNIKIGNGNAYVQDLVFVDQKTRELLMEHINNNDIHVTLGNKSFWNNKINVDDAYEQIHDELEDETLILTRN